jgi:hypothetical protein
MTTSERVTCPECGFKRVGRPTRKTDLCTECLADAKSGVPAYSLEGGSWQLDPVKRIQVWVGDLPKLTDNDLAEYGYEKPHYTPRQQPIKHGTEGGYMQERRRGQIPCDDCRTAATLAGQIRTERRRGWVAS